MKAFFLFCFHRAVFLVHSVMHAYAHIFIFLKLDTCLLLNNLLVIGCYLVTVSKTSPVFWIQICCEKCNINFLFSLLECRIILERRSYIVSMFPQTIFTLVIYSSSIPRTWSDQIYQFGKELVRTQFYLSYSIKKCWERKKGRFLFCLAICVTPAC